MPRQRRFLLDGHAYHLLNRGNRKQTIFQKPADYWAFLSILAEAATRFPVPLLAACLMRNHWHLVVWPTEAASISAYMHWVLNAHVHRYHRHYGLTGLGHLYQDRYKAFPIQDDRHLYTVMRYVEANPLRARLINRAEDWEWSSLTLRDDPDWREILTNGDRVRLPEDWLSIVNDALPGGDLESLRTCSRTGDPFGDPEWMAKVRRK